MTKNELTQSLKCSASIYADFAQSIPDENLFIKHGEGFWSIYQHLAHLADAQKMITGRLNLFLENVRPPIVPFNPEKHTEQMQDTSRTIKEIIDAFVYWRSEELKIIEAADDDIWRRSIEHPEYKLYTFEIMVRHILFHDGFHLHRVEELWLMHDEYISNM